MAVLPTLAARLRLDWGAESEFRYSEGMMDSLKWLPLCTVGGYTVAERWTDMPVAIVDITNVPKTVRNRTSPVKSSVEWQDTLNSLQELKSKQAVKIEFSPATLKLAKNVPFTFKRLLQRHLKNEELTGFTVFLRGKDARGNNILYVKKTKD